MIAETIRRNPGVTAVFMNVERLPPASEVGLVDLLEKEKKN